LLIEDDSFMRDMIILMLETANYTVTGVGNGAEALRQLTECANYTAIISDMYLPDTNAFKIFEQVAAACPGLPFLILTSETDEAVVQKATNLGITYISKDENFADTILTALTNLPTTKSAPTTLSPLPAKLFHDLSQPLNSIKMTAGGILFLLNQGKKLPDAELIECMENISSQTDNLAHIIKSLGTLLRRSENPPN